MITNGTEYERAAAHLDQFERALAYLSAAAGEHPTKLQQLEIEAVEAVASGLRHEVASSELGLAPSGRPQKCRF